MYCRATRLRTLEPSPGPPQPCKVGSLSERKARKFTREAGRNQTVDIWGQESMKPFRLRWWWVEDGYPRVVLKISEGFQRAEDMRRTR